MGHRTSPKRYKKPVRKHAPARKASHRRKKVTAATESPAQTALHPAAVGPLVQELPPELFAQSVIHVLGKNPGRAICGAVLPASPPSPLQKAWGALEERRGVLAGLETAMARAVASLPGSARPCGGCMGNVARMKAADDAIAAGKRTAAKTKAQPIERELEGQRYDYNGEDEDEHP